MKAVVFSQYGPPEVLSIKEVPKPAAGNGEVLVRIHATTVNRTDTGLRSAKYFVSRIFTGLTRPSNPIAGSEFAGKIVEIGANVTDYTVGDDVFGFEDVRAGAHAQYMVVAADGSMAKMPKGYTYQQLAPAGEGATYALNIIQAASLKKGQKVLVYGASGAIGSAAVQILKHQGLSVTAVCGTSNLKLIKSLGADSVISYETEDFTQLSDRFDFIFDAVGKSSYGACKHLLKPRGTYCSTELGKGGQNPLLAIWSAMSGSKRVIFPVPKINKQKMQYIQQLIAAKAYRPVIDRTYPLSKIVEAARYVETGQKTGNVVITVG